MDLQREIELLKKQLEERRRADDAEKARLRLKLEEARAEIKADETYFDRLVKENERLKADKRRLENGGGPSLGHSSSLESPALSGSSAGVSESPDHGVHPIDEPPGNPTQGDFGIKDINRATAGRSPARGAAAVSRPRSRERSPLRADTSSSQGRPPGSAAAGLSAQLTQLDALANGEDINLQQLPDRSRWTSPGVTGADHPTLLPSRKASDPGQRQSPPVGAQGGYSHLRPRSQDRLDAGRSPTYGGSADTGDHGRAAGQMLALLGPASSAHGRNASELMHPADMRLGPESDVRELAGTLSRVLDELEPLRALLPALGRLPAALSALDSLPRIQEMASRAVQMSAQNKEELRTVSRMVAVGSDIIDQNRKTVSQLQERMTKEEAEGQARAAASNRATQRVEATVTALRREQKQSAQSVQSVQNELGSLQAAQLPTRLSDVEAESAALKAEIAALTAKIAAQEQQQQQQQKQQQQVPVAARHVPAPAPPTAPFPGAAAPGPRPPAVPHPTALAALNAATSAASAVLAAAPAAQSGNPATKIGTTWPPSLQQRQSPPELSAVPAFCAAGSQLPIQFQLLMPTPGAIAAALGSLPPPQAMSQPTGSTQAAQAAQTSAGAQPSAAAKPSGDQKHAGAAQESTAAQKQSVASVGGKPSTPVLARQGLTEFGVVAKLGAGNPSVQPAQGAAAAASSSPAVSAPASTVLWQPGITSFLQRPAAGSQQANNKSRQERQVDVDRAERDLHGLWRDTCGACEAAFGFEEAFLLHLNSKEHREILIANANTYQVHSDEVKLFREHFDWACRLCDRSFSNLKAYAAHCTQSKAHEAKLAAKINRLPFKGRKKSRHLPVLEGKMLRNAWLATYGGSDRQSLPAHGERNPSPTVRHITIDPDPFRAVAGAEQAGDGLGSPQAEAVPLPELGQLRSREQSVEEGELIPGQPFQPAAVPPPQPSSTPQAALAEKGPQAVASGAAGGMYPGVEVRVEEAGLAASEEIGRARSHSPANSQQATAQQQQARQAYALQRQSKELKRQEQLQRLNKSLGFAVAAPVPAASTSAAFTQPALSPPSLPPQQPLVTPPSIAAPVGLTPAPSESTAASTVQRAAVAASTAVASSSGAGTPALVPSMQAFGSPQAAQPAASASLPSPGAAAAALFAAMSGSNAATLPDMSALPSPAAVAGLGAGPSQQADTAMAEASAAVASGNVSSQQAEAMPLDVEQRPASSALPGASAVAATADILVGLLASQPAAGASDDSVSKTAQEFLDGLSWSQSPAAFAGSGPSTSTAAPSKLSAASAQPTAVAQPVGGLPSQDAGPSIEAAVVEEKALGAAQEDTSPAVATGTPSVPEAAQDPQSEQEGEAQTLEAASNASLRGVQEQAKVHAQEATQPSAVSAAPPAEEQAPSSMGAGDHPAPVSQAEMPQPAADALPSRPPSQPDTSETAAVHGGPSEQLWRQEEKPAPPSADPALPSQPAAVTEPAAPDVQEAATVVATAALGGDQQASTSAPPVTEALPEADAKPPGIAQAASSATTPPPATAVQASECGSAAAVRASGARASVRSPAPWTGRDPDSPLLAEQHPGVAAKLAKVAADKAAAKLMPQPPGTAAAASKEAAPVSASHQLPAPAMAQLPPHLSSATQAASYAAGQIAPPPYQYRPGPYMSGHYGAPSYASPYHGHRPYGAQAAYSAAQWQQQPPFAAGERQPMVINAAASRSQTTALPPGAALSAPAAQGAGTTKKAGEGAEPDRPSAPSPQPQPPVVDPAEGALDVPASVTGSGGTSDPSPDTAKQRKEARRGGSPGKSSAPKTLVKRHPTIVLKLPSSLPTPPVAPATEPQAQDAEKPPSSQPIAAEAPAAMKSLTQAAVQPPSSLPIVAEVQGRDAQPRPDLQKKASPVEEPRQKVAAPTAAPDGKASKEAAPPVDQKIEAVEADAVQSGSQSPKTPLYFRLTDIALGEGTLDCGSTAGGYGLTGFPAPLSTAATVIRSTSAARSGAAAAAAKTGLPAQPGKAGSAWAARPATKATASPGPATAAAAPVQQEKSAPSKTAGAAPPASRKRLAEAARALERPVKRTVIRTGCRPPVQQPAKAGTAATTAAPKAPAVSLDSASTSSTLNPSTASAAAVPGAKTPPQAAAAAQRAPQLDKGTAAPSIKSPEALTAQQRNPVGASQQASMEAPGKEPVSAQKGGTALDTARAQQQSKQGEVSSAARSAPRELPAAAQKPAAPQSIASASSSGSKEVAAIGDRSREASGKVASIRKDTERPASTGNKPATPSVTGGEKKSSAAVPSSKPRVVSPVSISTPRRKSQGARPTAEKDRARGAEKADAAKGVARREASKQQPSDTSRGTSHSRRPDVSSTSERRPAQTPKHTSSARPNPSKEDRSVDHTDHRSEHRSATKPRSVDSHPPQRPSARDNPSRDPPRVRERDRAFGAPTAPSSPATLSVRSSASARSAAPAAAVVGAKRPREDDGREERRQQPPAKKPAAPAAEKPAPVPGKVPAKKLIEATPKPSVEASRKPVPSPVQRPVAPATKPPAAIAAKPAAAAAEKPAHVSARKPVPVPATPAQKPSTADKAAPASAPARASSGSVTSAGASSGHQQIPAPKRTPHTPVSAPVAASQATSALTRQQQQQQRPSPGSKDRRVQLEEGIAEGRGGARTSAQAPANTSHGGRVVTISSDSQPGPPITVGGHPRPERVPPWAPQTANASVPHHPAYPKRAQSPHPFQHGPPGPQYGGGPPPMPPEQQFRAGPPYEERLPQLGGPPGLHMPPVPSLPPYPPPFLPPLYSEPPFPERGPHREQPPQHPPMFDGGAPGGYPGPQQPPTWATGTGYLLPDGYPYFYEG